MLPRQYVKNVGRELVVTKNDEQKVKGKLLSADQNEITLEPLPDKKKKESISEPVIIAYSDIDQAKIILSFK
jgi:ribosome maturation factor RimP